MRLFNDETQNIDYGKLMPIFPVRTRFRQFFLSDDEHESEREYDTDNYLAEILEVLKVRSLVVGIGGAGNNMVSRLQELGVGGINTLNINTDAHDLYYSNAQQKILIGKDVCNGMGSGNNPFIGVEAAKEDINRLNKVLKADIVFLTCGLGGGTGTGAAPIIAREAKKNGAIVVSFCSIPFKSEGIQKRMRAKRGLAYLAQFSDTLIPLPNDNLLGIIPNAPLLTCFKVMDEIIVRSMREIVNLINNCGVVNIDFADIKRIFEKTSKYPSGLIGITESLGQEEDLIRKAKLAIHNPLLKPDTKKIDNCIVSVSGDHRLSLLKMHKILSTISRELPQDAQLKLGTNINPSLKSKIRIMVLGKGPISPYVKSAVDSEKMQNFQENIIKR
ncbi:MAG: cell division protein FtsZ [Promethearchaeota archaeon]